jgi:hypothetical protein
MTILNYTTVISFALSPAPFGKIPVQSTYGRSELLLALLLLCHVAQVGHGMLHSPARCYNQNEDNRVAGGLPIVPIDTYLVGNQLIDSHTRIACPRGNSWQIR